MTRTTDVHPAHHRAMLGNLGPLAEEVEMGVRVLTDSGGVQEESCILGVPCVTLRDNTKEA